MFRRPFWTKDLRRILPRLRLHPTHVSHKIAIDLIAAARPNFMKIAPLYHALAREPWCRPRIVHTGQHYDANMSDAFFTDLLLPKPDVHLGVGKGSHAEQTGRVMIEYEKVCLASPPDWIVVVGDVNSTLACALVGAKSLIRVAHLEAGLRSGDRTMPEEINRIVTDSIADVLWTPSEDGNEHLAHEGVAADKVELVGNIMLDSFELLAPKIRSADAARKLGLRKQHYGVVTLHRPSNVDDEEKLSVIVNRLVSVASRIPLVFPVHPRTRERLTHYGLVERIQACGAIRMTEPLSYIEFMSLIVDSRFALTDSGGVQEETSYLGIPCLTLRENTERPVTVRLGTNRLVTCESVDREIDRVLGGTRAAAAIPFWDGRTAHRVVQSIERRSDESGTARFARA
jgi:UDP-N-acetylglucosamine 2-epimerase (non-hydrolysing)